MHYQCTYILLTPHSLSLSLQAALSFYLVTNVLVVVIFSMALATAASAHLAELAVVLRSRSVILILVLPLLRIHNFHINLIFLLCMSAKKLSPASPKVFTTRL